MRGAPIPADVLQVRCKLATFALVKPRESEHTRLREATQIGRKPERPSDRTHGGKCRHLGPLLVVELRPECGLVRIASRCAGSRNDLLDALPDRRLVVQGRILEPRAAKRTDNGLPIDKLIAGPVEGYAVAVYPSGEGRLARWGLTSSHTHSRMTRRGSARRPREKSMQRATQVQDRRMRRGTSSPRSGPLRRE